MLIIFTVNDQKVTHDLGQRTLVAGSSGVVKAAFTFDNSWDGLDVVVVFSNSGKKCNNKPIKYDGVTSLWLATTLSLVTSRKTQMALRR